ncbi:MAG: GNAT family N-acetyltransferase [Phormidesmis sp.]
MNGLRPYQATDFEPLIELWWESWHSSSGYEHHKPIEDWQQRWLHLEKHHDIVVIEGQRTIVAFAALDSQAGLLSQLFVSPQWQRRGLGTRLMKWATAQCPNGFTLKTAADNREARAFYEKCGLTASGHSINDFNGYPEIEYATSHHPLALGIRDDDSTFRGDRRRQTPHLPDDAASPA